MHSSKVCSTRRWVMLNHRRSQHMSRSALFFTKKLTTFLVVALKTHAKSTKITSHRPDLPNFLKKYSFSASGGGVHSMPGGALTTFPCKSPIFSSAPWVHVHPMAYPYVLNVGIKRDH